MSGLTIHERFPPEPGAVGRARKVLEPLRPRLPGEKFDDIALLVSELVTNSIRHADLQRGQWVDLHVRHAEGIVRVEVTDPGHGFSLATQRHSVRGGVGWGLFLMDQIASRWGVK